MFIRLIFLILFGFFILYTPSRFLKLDYFKIKEIIIKENSKIFHGELTNLTKNLYNRNTFEVEYLKLKKFLEKDIRIENVEIQQVGLGKLELNIEEKSISYYAQINNNLYLVDKNGRIFGYMFEKKKESLPLIVAKTRQEIKEISELLNKLKEKIIYSYISQIYKVSNDEYSIVLVDGVEIKTNFEVTEDRYEILETLYSELKKEKKIHYIDLRFDDYIIKYLEA